MKVIGITGGIGSGKSMVSMILRKTGAPVYDADSRAKYLMVHDPALRSGIVELFGSDSYTSEGELNRSLISARAFSDPGILTQLNALVHPATGRDFFDWIELQKSEGHLLAFKEAAILFESGAYLACDAVITVYAPSRTRVERVIVRDKVAADAVMARMARQWPEQQKIQRSDWMIINDGRQALIPQVLKAIAHFSILATDI
ncbi:MAG: dephospho-CoA kinase [Bacteroidia bacterium]|nr:dephospho-CoA kinase [Bacteroidia bacterium]